MRTFLAVELPESILHSIRVHILPFQAALPDDCVRWVPIENMHVTIKFLGGTDPSVLGDVKNQIESCSREGGPFDLEFEGLGAFPSRRRPRVLWIGTKGSQQDVGALHGCIEERLEPLGFDRDSRSLHLHVTWGRVRRGTRASELRELSEELSGLELESVGQMRVDHLTLFESNLRPSGAEYRVVQRFPLGSS